MSYPIQVCHFYQVWEEVLTTRCWYFNTTPNDAFVPVDAEDFCVQMYSNFQLSQIEVGQQFRLLATEVKIPNEPVNNIGPWRFIRSATNSFAPILDAAPDMVNMKVQLSGVSALLKPVRGALYISGVVQDEVDCNVYLTDYADRLTTQLNAAFPNSVIPSGGPEFRRVIKHMPALAANPEYVPTFDLSVSPMPGTRLDRVMDRTQGRSCPVEA